MSSNSSCSEEFKRNVLFVKIVVKRRFFFKQPSMSNPRNLGNFPGASINPTCSTHRNPPIKPVRSECLSSRPSSLCLRCSCSCCCCCQRCGEWKGCSNQYFILRSIYQVWKCRAITWDASLLAWFMLMLKGMRTCYKTETASYRCTFKC